MFSEFKLLATVLVSVCIYFLYSGSLPSDLERWPIYNLALQPSMYMHPIPPRFAHPPSQIAANVSEAFNNFEGLFLANRAWAFDEKGQIIRAVAKCCFLYFI